MYHIVNTKSKTHPFQVINVDAGNGEVINTSQGLKSKQAAFKNIIANMGTVYPIIHSRKSVCVQDDTLTKQKAYILFEDGIKEPMESVLKYIPGKNPKKKK